MYLTKNRWFRRFAFGAVAALSLFAAAMPTSPAQAREFGFRTPIVAMHHASFFSRIFAGHGGWHHEYRHWR
jgi:hypothetical protein